MRLNDDEVPTTHRFVLCKEAHLLDELNYAPHCAEPGCQQSEDAPVHRVEGEESK